MIADATGIFNYKVTGNDTVEVKNMTAKGKTKKQRENRKKHQRQTVKLNKDNRELTANALKGQIKK